MDHTTTWFNWFPGHQWLVDTLNGHYRAANLYPVRGGDYHDVHHVYAALLVAAFLIIMSLIARWRLKNFDDAVIPSKSLTPLTMFEVILEAVMGMMQSILGNDYKRYVPMIGTCALFILFSNLLGLIPGFVPPTDNLNTTFALAGIVFVWFNWHGFRMAGIGHITHMLNPAGTAFGWALAPLIGPIEIFGLFLRPITLGLRLAANMIGDHAVLFAFAGIFPLFVPLPLYFLGLLICIVQTAVFCILSTVYIALHTPDEDH